jgi:hypothetical protein
LAGYLVEVELAFERIALAEKEPIMRPSEMEVLTKINQNTV